MCDLAEIVLIGAEHVACLTGLKQGCGYSMQQAGNKPDRKNNGGSSIQCIHDGHALRIRVIKIADQNKNSNK